MNTIEVCLAPKLFDNYSIRNKIVVVVDILRATTIITTMFQNGLSKLIPVKTLDEAKELKKQGLLVAAERNGQKVDFADFDNSPFSFTTDSIGGKTIVYSSTNGTNTINLVKDSDEVIIASFLNLTSVSNYLLHQGKDVLILCSGWMGDFCTEDFLFAGALSHKLTSSNKYQAESDSVKASIDLWNLANQDFAKYIKSISQYKRLCNFGFKNIVEYCFKIDTTKLIPVVNKNHIIAINKLTHI